MMPHAAFQEVCFRKSKLGLGTQTTIFHSKINASFPRGSQQGTDKNQKSSQHLYRGLFYFLLSGEQVQEVLKQLLLARGTPRREALSCSRSCADIRNYIKSLNRCEWVVEKRESCHKHTGTLKGPRPAKVIHLPICSEVR